MYAFDAKVLYACFVNLRCIKSICTTYSNQHYALCMSFERAVSVSLDLILHIYSVPSYVYSNCNRCNRKQAGKDLRVMNQSAGFKCTVYINIFLLKNNYKTKLLLQNTRTGTRKFLNSHMHRVFKVNKFSDSQYNSRLYRL